MTTSGLVVMSVSILTVLALTVFCFYKILTEKPKDLTALSDIDPQDAEES